MVGEKPALPDDNAAYAAEFVVDLDLIDEPMIADPDVNNEDVLKRYTHDTIRPSHIIRVRKKSIWASSGCMVTKATSKFWRVLRNIEAKEGDVSFGTVGCCCPNLQHH